MKRFLYALLACLAGFAASAAPALVQSTSGGHVQWTGAAVTDQAIDFASNVTAGNSIVCVATPYHSLVDLTVPTDDGSSTYTEVADSGVPGVNVRAYVWAAHAVTGGYTGVDLHGGGGLGLFGQAECYEFSGIAASPNDQTCAAKLTGTAGDDAEGNCAIGTLAQAEELVVSALAYASDADSNVNITGPTGGGTYTNVYLVNDAAANSGGSADYTVTSATTGFTVQYAHDDLPSAEEWAIAAATFKAASAAAPAFDSGPTVTAVDSNTFRVTYDANADADTIECGAWLKDATAPTAAQIDAGTGARGTGTEASTGASDTLDFDVTDDPAFPIYDVYCELEEGVNNYSSVGTQVDEALTAPTGYQHVTISGTLAGFLLGSGAATGDITQGSTTVSPGSYALTIQATGAFSYAAGGDASKQTFSAWYYDVSAGGWSDAARVTVCVNNAAPRISPTYALEYSVVEDIAIPTFDLNIDSVDDNSDTITVAALSGSLPTGLSLASNDVTGTPTTVSVSRTVQRHTDECGAEDALDVSHTWLIRPERPLFTGFVTDLTYTVDTAISAVDFTTEFDHDDSMVDPAMDLTYTLLQLGSSALVDTVNGAASNAYVLTLDDTTGIVAGDYITTESDTEPHLVLAVYTNDLELATPIDAADNDDVNEVAVAAEDITGIALSAGGSLTGTPTVVGSYADLFIRATDAESDIKDTSLFDMSIFTSGGSGGKGANSFGMSPFFAFPPANDDWYLDEAAGF